MLLNHFFRVDFHSRPEDGIQELMRAILVRTNLVPGVRHHIGWRGLKQSAAAVECWTAKISGFAGVFGLLFDGLDSVSDWHKGRFPLAYFPGPAEELVERCSLRAAALTQRPDYLEKVRDFASDLELSRLFTIGCTRLAVAATGEALALELESLSTQRTIAEDGILLPRNDQIVQMIQPGGYDQNFPSLKVAEGLFNALAASVTFNLGQPPVYMSERRFTGAQIVYDRTGASQPVPAADVCRIKLLLGYGECRFGELDEDVHDCSQPVIRSLYWRPPQPPPPDYMDRLWWRAHELQALKTIDKAMAGLDERPPFIILTGFLGSGKTSFLQHFIEYQTQRSRFVAVIQNEIGEIGLDGKLLDYKVVEIDEGCVCCTLVGSLKRAVPGILESFSPDTIILETSGLANPKNLLDEFEELSERVRLDVVVTMVDALNFKAGIENYAVASDQITTADVLVLNKTDLVDESRLQDLRSALRQLNPYAPIFTSCRGDLNPAMIFDAAQWVTAEAKSNLSSGSEACEQSAHTRRHSQLESRTIRLAQVLDRTAFLEAVASMPSSIFRIKGIIEISPPHETVLFQYVAGRYDISTFSDTRARERFLTCIGNKEDASAFEAAERLIEAAAIQPP